MIGFKNDKLIYHKFKAISKGSAYDPYDLKDPWYQKWKKLVTDYNANAPDGLKNMDQNAEDLWAWMSTERAFITSAF